MRYAWTVVEGSGGVNYGTVDTFEEAVAALKAWHGDGVFPARSYQIMPLIPENYSETAFVLGEEER